MGIDDCRTDPPSPADETRGHDEAYEPTSSEASLMAAAAEAAEAEAIAKPPRSERVRRRLR